MFFKLSIFHKMLIAPLLAVALFGLYIVNIYIQQVEGKKYIDSIYQKHFPILNIANENIILLDNIIKFSEDAVVASEESWLENNNQYKKNIENNFKILNSLAVDKKNILNMQSIFQEYFNTTMKLSTLMIKQSIDWEKMEVLAKDMATCLKLTRTLFMDFQDEQKQKLQDTIDRTNEYGEKIVHLGIIIGTISLALIIILTMILSLSTKKSLKELLSSVKNIATKNPDFSRRLEKTSDDELGKLVEEFNNFTKKLQGDYEELALAKSEAETANKIKSEFVANISHEIRTPLNAIIGFSELLNKTEVSSKQKSYLESISSGGDTLLAIINDILDISKIEAGKLEIQYEEVSLNLILKDIKMIFLQKIKDKGLDLKINIDESLPSFIFIDDIRLRQILLNIVGNAIKFTYKGSICLNVKASNFKDNKFNLQIDVIDTGIGIPKEQQNKIFESFVQKDGQSNRQYGGTGLGLSICLKLIRMMNGNIKIKSKEDEGSTFSIILNDLTISNHNKNIEYIEEHNETLFESSNILVVDDIELNRKLIIESLENKNISFYEASNGKEAIQIVKDKKPDLVLMDIKMPILNGFEATRILKNGEYKNIPVIAITASLRSKEIQRSSELFNAFISKPINHNILIEELKRFLPYKTEPIESKTNLPLNILENVLEIDTDIKDIFIKEFEENISQSWEKASLGCSFEDIQEFTNNLNIFAKKYKQKSLQEFIKNIDIAIEKFDITMLENLIAVFSRFLKEVNND